MCINGLGHMTKMAAMFIYGKKKNLKKFQFCKGSVMQVHYPKLYNMTHLLALNVLLLPKDLTIIFICYYCRWCCAVWRP